LLFTEINFGGRYFCEAGSRTDNAVDAKWKNRIQSIEVRDGASVQICSQTNRQGECTNITSSDPELDPPLFNHVYSFRTKED